MMPVSESAPAPPLPLLTAAEMQDWDRRAIDRHHVPEAVLMEAAGRAAAHVLHALYPEGRVAAAVGRGNNGGDALVLLRSLRAWGREVVAVPVGDAAVTPALLHGWDLPVAVPGEAETVFRDAAVLVDGILGTGATGAPREPQAAAIRAMHAARRPILALDGPTGVDLTRGSVAGEAVRAEVTVTFGAPKRGLLLHPGRSHAGRIVVVETGFPPLGAGEVAAGVITPQWALRRGVTLPSDSHKGTAGRLIVLAGRPEMGGAAILCGHAALRSGVGIVRIVSAGPNRVPVQTVLPEALFVDRDEGDLVEVAKSARAIVAGPGMGTDEGAKAALRTLLEAATCPVLLDADALTLLAGDESLAPGPAAGRYLLTPHPGEMSRLLGRKVEEITVDPFLAVQEARDRFGCAVLLKGAPTLVAAPGEPTLTNVTGHSGVGVGGMGDTLAGVVGAMLARGTSPYEAAALAIYHAGRAADRVGRGRPLLPRDVADALPHVLVEEEVPVTALPLPEVLLDLPRAV